MRLLKRRQQKQLRGGFSILLKDTGIEPTTWVCVVASMCYKNDEIVRGERKDGLGEGSPTLTLESLLAKTPVKRRHTQLLENCAGIVAHNHANRCVLMFFFFFIFF